MKFNKPKFWQKKNFIAFLLYPLSLITYLVNYCKKLSSKNKFNLKTICIGNLYVGGTGKTSLSIFINELLKKKHKTIFIKKNYNDQLDEINLLRKKGDVISNNNRLKSLLNAEKKNFSIAILDDGLQQKNIKYDLKIVCFNSDEGIGNGYLLPAGPLRESIHELKNYDIAILNGEKKNNKLKQKIKNINQKIKVFEGTYKPVNLKQLNRKKKYFMFCGLGNPQEFEKTLSKFKFQIKKKIIFPDHYKLSKDEVAKIKISAKKEKLNIITTEKDYFRLSKKQRNNIKYLKIKLRINKLKEFKKILKSI